MSSAQKKQLQPIGTPAERIVEVASELFYKQGYRATGINEVIKKSGVAKATFYSHFPSKDDLCKVCLQGLSKSELEFVDCAIESAKGPVKRFLAILESLETWALDTNFRGCAFLNMASEVPDPTSPLRKEGMKLYDNIRSRAEEMSRELIASDIKRYGHLDIEQLANDYMVVFAGAVALTELYHAVWPIQHGVKNMRRLIGD